MFNEVFDFIKEKLTPSGSIKIIEWYLDQDNISGGITNSPAVYVLFQRPVINVLTKTQQEVVCEFDIMLFTDSKKSNSKLTTGNPHIEVEAEIRTNLWKFEEIGGEPISRNEGMIKSVMTYRHKWVEKRSLKPVAHVIDGADISPIIEID